MIANFKAIQQHYIFWLDTLGFNQHTTTNYGNRVNDFFVWLKNKNITSINLITQNHITDFFEYQQYRPNTKHKGTTLSVSYLNDYFSAIDKLCEFLHQMGAKTNITPTNYRIALDKEQRIRNITPFSIEEIKILQSCIDDIYSHLQYDHRALNQAQLKLIFVLYYGCGLRLSEGYNLTFKDIDFNKRTVFIRQGKNYKDRIIPMSDSIYNALQDYMYNCRNQIKCGHNRLFIYSPIGLSKNLKYLHSQCHHQGVQSKRLSFHVLRHSIATHLLQNGMPIENIAKFLGHGCLTSTTIYTHIINR
jgi:integrase/recombinase XerD